MLECLNFAYFDVVEKQNEPTLLSLRTGNVFKLSLEIVFYQMTPKHFLLDAFIRRIQNAFFFSIFFKEVQLRLNIIFPLFCTQYIYYCLLLYCSFFFFARLYLGGTTVFRRTNNASPRTHVSRVPGLMKANGSGYTS